MVGNEYQFLAPDTFCYLVWVILCNLEKNWLQSTETFHFVAWTEVYGLPMKINPTLYVAMRKLWHYELKFQNNPRFGCQYFDIIYWFTMCCWFVLLGFFAAQMVSVWKDVMKLFVYCVRCVISSDASCGNKAIADLHSILCKKTTDLLSLRVAHFSRNFILHWSNYIACETVVDQYSEIYW